MFGNFTTLCMKGLSYFSTPGVVTSLANLNLFQENLVHKLINIMGTFFVTFPKFLCLHFQVHLAESLDIIDCRVCG